MFPANALLASILMIAYFLLDGHSHGTERMATCFRLRAMVQTPRATRVIIVGGSGARAVAGRSGGASRQARISNYRSQRMGSRTNGIVYEPDKLASRHRLAIAGAAVELVQVPPVPHAFKHCSSAHLLMFTETGKRSDGESRAEGHAISTMRDTSNTFSILPAGLGYDGWTIPTVPARYLSLAVEPDSPLIGALTRDVLWRAPVVYGRQIPEDIKATLVKLRASVGLADNHIRLYSEALFQVLLIELAQWLDHQSARPVVRGGLTPRQQRLVCEFIRKEAASDISLAELARLCDLSPNHFASAFKSSLGVAPHQYQVSCRMEHAKQMLENPSIPIIDIALTVGYAGPSAFAASFRRQTGTTPRDYRKSRS